MNDDITKCFAQNFINDLKPYLRNDVEAYYKSEKLLERKTSFNDSEIVYGFTDYSIALTTDAGYLIFSPEELQQLIDLIERHGDKKSSLNELFKAFTRRDENES